MTHIMSVIQLQTSRSIIFDLVNVQFRHSQEGWSTIIPRDTVAQRSSNSSILNHSIIDSPKKLNRIKLYSVDCTMACQICPKTASKFHGVLFNGPDICFSHVEKFNFLFKKPVLINCQYRGKHEPSLRKTSSALISFEQTMSNITISKS